MDEEARQETEVIPPVEYTGTAHSSELGFDTVVGPIPLPRQPLSEEEEERALGDAIRQKSLVRVDVLSEILLKRAIQSEASVKTVVDAIEVSYKLSGLASKNAPKVDSAQHVSITINMPSTSAAEPRVIAGLTLPDSTLELPELTEELSRSG